MTPPKQVKCPYCKAKTTVNADRYNDRDVCECNHCKKKFAIAYTVEVVIDEVTETPCLNDANEHFNIGVGHDYYQCFDCRKKFKRNEQGVNFGPDRIGDYILVENTHGFTFKDKYE